jgi:lipid A ethanolaminephosphotransferase
MLSGTTADVMRTDCEQFLRRPSLYAYAAQAGYEMHFVNSQDYLVWIAHDKEMLGPRLRTVTADRNRLPRWQADHALLDDIVDFVAAGDRTFTMVAKRGIHYPYYDKCPPRRRRYTPCLQTPAWSDSFLENVNAYDNGVWWACDEYLCRLHEALARTGKSVLVIYTSDHGQVLPGEPIEGYTFKRTHAMIDSPSPAVADVPLILLATGEAWDFLAALPERNVGATSHFEIFPSVLRLMGYDPVDVEPKYGPDLWSPRGGLAPRVYFEGNPVKRCRKFTPPDNAAKLRLIREHDARRRMTNDE